MAGVNDPLGLRPRVSPAGEFVQPIERVVRQRVLHRVLAFTRRSIDDVVNDPIAKNEVYGYYKLHRQVERAGEVRDLERQWNPTA